MGNQIGSGTNSYLPNIKNIRNLQLFKDYVSNSLKQIEEAFDYWIKSPYVKKKTLSKEEFEELFSQLFVDPIKHYEILKVIKINAVITIDVFIIFSLFCSQCTLKDKIKFIIHELILRREYFIKQTQNTYLQQITSSSSVVNTNGSSTTVPTTMIVPSIIVPTSLRLESLQQMSYHIFCSMPILFKKHDIDDHHLIKTDLYNFIEISLKHFIERTLLSGIMQQEAKKLEDSDNNYHDITSSIVSTTAIIPPKEPKSSLAPLKESIKDHLPSDRLYSFNEIWHWTQDNFHIASYLEHIHNISVQIYTKIFSDFSKIKQKSFVLRTSFFASNDDGDSNQNSPSRNNNMSPLSKLLYQFQPNITDPFDSLLSRRTFIWKYSIQEFLQDEYYQSSIVPGSSHQSVRGIPYVMNDCPIIYALEHMVLSQIFSVAVFQFTSSNAMTSFSNMTININNLSSLPSTNANATATTSANLANNANNTSDNSDINNAGASSTYRAMVMEKEKLSTIQNASVELIGIINYQTIVRYLLEHSPKYLLKDILLEERKKREKRLSYEFSLTQVHLSSTKPTNTINATNSNNIDSEFDDNFSDYIDEDDENQSVTSVVTNSVSNTNIINSMNNMNETNGIVNPTLSFITETRSMMDASVKRRLRNMRWAKKLGEGLLTTNVTNLLYRKVNTTVNKDVLSGSEVPVLSKQGALRFGSISTNNNTKDKARINNNKQIPQVLPQYQDLPMEFVTMEQSVYNLLHLFSLGHQTVPILNHNANNTGTTNTTIPNLFPTNKPNEYQGLPRTTTIGAIDRFILALVQNHHISDFLYTYYDELFLPKVQNQSIMYTIHSLRPTNDMHELAEYALSVENKFNLGSMLFRMTRDRKQPVNNLPGSPLFSPLDSKSNHDDERVDACLLLTKPLQATKENTKENPKENIKEKEMKSEVPSTTNTPTAAASSSATPTSTQASSESPIPNPKALKCCGVLTLHHSLELLYWMFRLHNLPNATNATSVASHLQQPQQISNPRSPRAHNNTSNNNSNNNSNANLPVPDINLKNLQELIDLFRQGKFHVPISTIPIVNTNHCIVNNTSLTSNLTLGTSIAQQILNIYNIDTTNWTAFTMLNEKISNIEADFVNEFHAAKQMQSLGELANPKILYNYDEFVDLIQPIQPNTEAHTNTKNTTAGGLRKTRTYTPSSSQLSGSQAAFPPSTPMNNMAPSPRGMPSPRGGLPSPRGGYEPSSPRQSANSNPNNSTVSTPIGGRPIRGRKSGATTITAQQRILREKKYAEAKNRVDRTRRLEEWFRKVKVLSVS